MLDAFTDVGMGVIVDQSQPTKDGRFMPWVKRMAIPVTVASLSMYNIFILDWSLTAKMIYISIVYILWGSITYTGVNIPYGSMASVISAKSEDRAGLSSFRTMGSIIAGLLVGVVVPHFIYTTDNAGNQVVDAKSFFLIALIFSGVALICYYLFSKLCIERVSLPIESKEKLNILDDLKELIKDRAFVTILLNTLFVLTAQLASQTLNQYLFLDYFNNTTLLPVLNLVNVLGMAASIPFVGVITKRFGKKEGGAVGLFIGAFAYLLLLIIGSTNPWIFIGLCFVAGSAMSFYQMVSYAYITDVIDNFQIETSKRKDGTIYAVYSFTRKLGQALAGGIGGWTLSLIGYNQIAGSQTPEVKTKLFIAAVGVPAICYLLGAIVLRFFYPLNKKKIEANEQIIRNLEK